MRHGYLLVYKESGPTSHDVVQAVRRTLCESHVGHLGTLDPLASGLLVLAVGAKALKTVELFSALPKEYEAELALGAVSTTYDRDGLITEGTAKTGWRPPPDSAPIRALIEQRFLGSITQVPPAFSAVHVSGKRAYERARNGEQVELPPREVDIFTCDVLEYHYPLLKLRIACGAGTYIRSLAHDLGQTMRCGAYLKALTRTKVGEWSLAQARPLDHVRWTDVLPLKDVLRPLSGIALTDAQWEELKFGRPIALDANEYPLIGWHDDLPVAILEGDRRAQGMVKPRKVL